MASMASRLLEPGEESIASIARRARFRRSLPAVPPITRSMATRVTRGLSKPKPKAGRKKKEYLLVGKKSYKKKAAPAPTKKSLKIVVLRRVQKHTTTSTDKNNNKKPAKKTVSAKKPKVATKTKMAAENAAKKVSPLPRDCDPSDNDDDIMFDLADFAKENSVDTGVEALDARQNDLLRNASSQTRQYCARKNSTESRFFEVLSRDAQLGRMCEIVPCAEFPGEFIRRFYLELGGRHSETKKRVFNRCLCTYALLGLFRQDGTAMEPNTCQTIFKILFAVFKVSFFVYPIVYFVLIFTPYTNKHKYQQAQGVIYSLTRDFNYLGGLASVLKTHWSTVRQSRPTFGSRDNRHVVTAEQDCAVRVGVLAGLVDIDDFDDLQLTCNWLMSKYFMQRGVKERKDLLWSKIVFGTYEVQGPLYGLPCVELMRDFACGILIRHVR